MNITVTKKSSKGLEVSFLNKKDLKLLKSDILKANGFEAKNAQMVIMDDDVYGTPTLFVGIVGVKSADDWRILGTKVTAKLKAVKAKSATIDVPKNCSAFVEGLYLGNYDFDTYKSEKKKSTLKTIYLTSKYNVAKTVKKAVAGAEAQCLTRDWVNTTPEDANSDTIERAVRKMFKDTSVQVDVYGEKELEKLGMNMHLAVNRASRHTAKTIKLTYEPRGKSNPKHIIAVGKGLTYDSGGLSLKPSAHMTTMKADKAGAMTVWGMMKYISEFGSENKVTVYMGIAENMVDGSAYKPDDVLVAMNGKTVHVKNTDAEGRLVLFDNLCLAQSENKKFDVMYSLATLTGAAVFQFGNEATGMVGFNDKLKKTVKKAGEEAGEIFMNAEFHKYMMKAVDDELADLSNTGTAGQGCQKAGLFLTNAITKKNKMKYLHLDIAGPAHTETAWGSNPAGASGFGVRTLINLSK